MASRQFNLTLKINGKEVENTLNGVGKELAKVRAQARNVAEGTPEWKRLNKEAAELEKRYGELRQNQRDFIEETKGQDMAMQDFGASIKQTLSGLATGDLVQFREGLKGVGQGFMGATRASLAFIATPIGMVITALGLAIAAVTRYFKDNEEGQNKWNKIMAISGAIIGNFTDLLSKLGGIIVNVFTNPVEHLKSFGKLLVENIVNRFKGILELIPGLTKAVGHLFKGEFKEAGKVASDAVLKVATGVENATDKMADGFKKATNAVKEFGEEVAYEAKRAAELADMEAEADKIERDLIVERGRVERKISEARRKAREEDNLSAEEQLKLLNEASQMEQELIDKEIAAAALRRDIMLERSSFSNSTKEDLEEEARAIAKVEELQGKKDDAARRLMRDERRVSGELRKQQQEAVKQQEQELERINALEADYIKKREDREADSAVKAAELEKKRALEKAKAVGAGQELLDQIAAEHDIAIEEAREKEIEEELKRQEEELQRMKDFEDKKRDLENQLRLQKAQTDEEREQIQKEIDLENEELEFQREREKFEAELEQIKLDEDEKNELLRQLEEGHENEMANIRAKFDKKELDRNKKFFEELAKAEENLNNAKRNAYGEGIAALQGFLDESTGVYKAMFVFEKGLATAEIITNAAKGIATAQANLAAVPPVIGTFPNPMYPVAVATTAKNVMATKITAASQLASIAAQTVQGFADGGYTDMFGMGYRDETGEEVAGIVHTGEYIVPKIVRQDPEVPRILDYLEMKRKQKLGINSYADGGDTLSATADNIIGEDANTMPILLERLSQLLERGIPAIVNWSYDDEMSRQDMENKLQEIKTKNSVKLKS